MQQVNQMGDGTHQLAYLVAFFIAQDYKNHENIAGLLTYDVATHNVSHESIPSQKPQKSFQWIYAFSSNTVMAVVPDSNRIPFQSTRSTTFQTIFSSI